VSRFGRQLELGDILTTNDIPDWARSLLKEIQAVLRSDQGVADPASDFLEELYGRRAPYDYRKATGQFFTPPPIAELMVRWALDKGATSFLDPSVGTGIFMRAALLEARKRGTSNLKLMGYEIDPILAKIAKMGIEALEFPVPPISEADFLTDQSDAKFDAIVANPPYIRHHEMTYTDDVFKWFDQRCRFRLSRLTNMYGLFLLKIQISLSTGGRAAVLTPSEFLNADFGVPIKRFLVDTGYLDTLVIFDNTQLVFNDILTTACVTMLDAERMKDQPLRIVHVPSMDAVEDVAESLLTRKEPRPGADWQQALVRKDTLEPGAKWTSVGIGPYQGRSSKLVPLGTIARTMRGIATGANSFFTLSAGEVEKNWIEEKYLRPCITKANYGRHLTFNDDDFEELRNSGKKSYLLYYVGGPISDSLRDYIKLGEQQGLHERYLTRHRDPWFLTEQREVAPIWVTVFGRGGLRFILNKAKIWNLTAFHCVYPEFDDQLMERALMTYLASNECTELVQREWRVYGDGLLKMEPRDVARVPTLDIVSLPATTIEELASLFDQLSVIERLNPAWRETPEMQQISKVIRPFL
jgi:adenine-specific DNA-methyltransferase